MTFVGLCGTRVPQGRFVNMGAGLSSHSQLPTTDSQPVLLSAAGCRLPAPSEVHP
jgi:hypothetical protein